MNKKATVMIIFITLIYLVNNLAHPVTPELVSSIGHGSLLLGALFATMSFANFVMSPFWGRISDRIGRKPCIIIGCLGYGLAQLGFGFSINPWIIIIFRLISGSFVASSYVSSMAYLIDVSEPKVRTQVMALYTALTGFSSTIGYLIGGVIGNQDYHQAFMFQSIMSILTGVLILIFLKESNKEVKVRVRSNFWKDILQYRDSLVPLLLLITMITSFFSTGFNNGFNSYMKFILDLSPKFIGIIMAVTGLIGLIMNIVIFPIIKRKYNDYNVLIISIIFISLSLSLAMYFESKNMIFTILILVIFFAFHALYKPILQSIISKYGHAHGEIMGLNNGFMALGNVGGSFYAGAVFALSTGFTFYSLAFILVIALILLFLKRKQFAQYGW